MPYGNVSFVTRLSPLHPGYVKTVWASDPPSSRLATATIRYNVEENMVIYTMVFVSSQQAESSQFPIPDREY
jgi:hypothetical protein